jgi:SAM-dependent methyltransferase
MNAAARFFDADYAGYDEDLPTLKAFAQRTGGPLVELGCGTGRVLVPLAKSGYDVTGVDASPLMLDIARAKAEAAGVSARVNLVEADYIAAPLLGPYKFAFIVMNPFLHLASQEEQVRALWHWHAHLAPGGLLLIEVLHPDVNQLAGLDGRVELHKAWIDPVSGATVQKLVARTVDLAEQTLNVTIMYDEIARDGQVRRTIVPFTLRYLWRFEAELLLEKAGFAIDGLYGDWDLSPFESESDHMVIVARRKK